MHALLAVLVLTAASASEAGTKSEVAWSAVVADPQIGTEDFSPANVMLASRVPTNTGQEPNVGGRFSLRLRWQAPDGALSAEAFVSLGVKYALDGEFEIPAESPFVRIGWRPGSWRNVEGLFLTVYPVDSQQLHLGWEYPATWGGTVYADRSERAPAAELRLARERWYGFAAARTDTTERENARWWMGLAGAGIEPLSGLRFELAGIVVGGTEGTWRGDSDKLGAVSSRLLYQRGEPIGPSVDFGRYGTAPNYFQVYLLPERYPGGQSAYVSLESTHVMNPASGTYSDALALQLRAKSGFWRAHLLGLYRSANFRSSGDDRRYFWEGRVGGTPYGGELVRGGADYHFAKPQLTPGLVLSAELPRFFESAFMASSSSEPDSRFLPYSYVVKDGVGLVAQRSNARKAIFSAKATLRWDWAAWLSVAGELGWMYDGNGAAWGLSDEKASWNGALLAQARL